MVYVIMHQTRRGDVPIAWAQSANAAKGYIARRWHSVAFVDNVLDNRPVIEWQEITGRGVLQHGYIIALEER